MENSVQPSSDNVAQTCGTRGNLFLRKIRRLIPINFWQEVKHISGLAGRVFLTELMMLLLNIVSFAFCGHLGKTELDALSLAAAALIVPGISMGVGLATACDTLISQTYGSKNWKRIGVILQRGILILMITCFPCWAIFVNIEHILLALKQSPAVAKLAQLYVKLFCPSLPAIFLHVLENSYLQNQGIIVPQIFVGLITNIFNAVVNYLFLYVLMLGVAGSAAASVLSQYCQAILLFVYIRWKKLHVKTWTGWSADCLQEWGHFTRLAIPSMFMLCMEWWSFHIGALTVGLINEVQLGAQSIAYQVITIPYRVSIGYRVAATVHVGNALGASNPDKAVNSAKVAIYCIVCISLVNTMILGAIKNVVGYIFTSDKEIVHLVADIIPQSAAFHFFDATTGVLGGVLRGAGKQKLGAIGNLVGYYIIGLPIGIALMFAAKQGVLGFWSGMLICVLVQLVFFLTVIYRINWNEASNQALINAGVKKDVDASNSASGGHIQEISTEVNTGNSAVDPIPNVCQLEQQINKDQVTDESSIVDTGVTTIGEILSTKQLIIRRGLAFLSGPLVLAIGLVIHFILAKDMIDSSGLDLCGVGVIARREEDLLVSLLLGLAKVAINRSGQRAAEGGHPARLPAPLLHPSDRVALQREHVVPVGTLEAFRDRWASLGLGLGLGLGLIFTPGNDILI
ncbi:multidrug and toxin extrusion protein 1-like [Carcharodon carcharias]|uniref:multidrug and toxin extrusion protein 1-like n=1 Tax=Carcharodon carcharias TaxID=13397 RepID=UPI001B7EFCDD|nr:multidrug and toxin extrusion protein 1-like [Carcharodon carcharias]